MKRNTLALAAGVALALGSSVVITADASFVNTSATLMVQGQAASRWQPDRFGPIVSSDTLWSIAMYYGDKTDLSVYEMMDLFIELNPQAFINGRADRMMDGFYLKVPQVAQAQQTKPAQEPKQEPAQEPQAASESAAAAATENENQTDTVSFSVEELTRLRDQLGESTALIERLNSENAQLQQRLEDVTRELNELQKKVNAEQVAEDDLQQQIAAEIAATTELDESAPVVTSEPAKQTAVEESTVEEKTTDDTQAARIVSETEEVAKQQSQEAAKSATTPASEPASEPAAKPAAKPVNKRQKPSDMEAFLAWLMQPFQLTLAILIPLLLAAIIWYVLYVRRLNREHLGPYNGALQAAEKDKNEEANQEPQTLTAYEEAEQAAAEEQAADMPEFERIDDAVDIDEGTDEDTADEAASEAEQLDDELVQLEQEGKTASEEVDEQQQEGVEDDDLDTLLNASFDDQAAEHTAAADVDTAPAEVQAKAEENDDMSLDFVIDELTQSNAKDEASSLADEDMTLTDDAVELEQFEDINLDDLDLEGLTTDDSNDNETSADTETDEGYLEIDDLLADADSDDADFESPRFDREAGQLDDEETPAGMLDLARAYIELDEYELARAELEKINQTDDDDAKREAAMLLQKLDKQGD